jgi:hypothetical protein
LLCNVVLFVIVTLQILFCSKCEYLLYTTLPNIIQSPNSHCLQAG